MTKRVRFAVAIKLQAETELLAAVSITKDLIPGLITEQERFEGEDFVSFRFEVEGEDEQADAFREWMMVFELHHRPPVHYRRSSIREFIQELGLIRSSQPN